MMVTLTRKQPGCVTFHFLHARIVNQLNQKHFLRHLTLFNVLVERSTMSITQTALRSLLPGPQYRAFATSARRDTTKAAIMSQYETEHENQTYVLPDGRRLGYAEYGPRNGRPLLCFHGYPSSRLEGEPLKTAAHARNIRILSLERPGFGISSPQPGRRIVDWPQDVHDFAKGMGLEKFAVLGGSGGGPYALACATEDAPTRGMLTGVGLFASAPPWSAGAHHMEAYRRWLVALGRRWPSALAWLLRVTVRTINWIASWPSVQRRVDALLDVAKEKASGAKPDEMTPEAKANRRERLLQLLMNEPFRQGPDAAVEEAKLLSAPDWGFDYADVSFAPVRIWHGGKDANSPVVMIRWLAERVPGSVLTVFEDDSHYSMFPYFERALDELVPPEGTEDQK